MISNFFWTRTESLFFFCLPVWKVSERNGISELINKHLQSNVTVLLIYNILMDRSHLQLYLTVHSFLYYFSQNTIAKSKQLKNKNGPKIPNCVTNTVQRSDRLRTKHLEGDSRCVICKRTTGDVLPEITQEWITIVICIGSSFIWTFFLPTHLALHLDYSSRSLHKLWLPLTLPFLKAFGMILYRR